MVSLAETPHCRIFKMLMRATDPTYFHGHAASIHLRIGGKDHAIGAFGILHPTVLEKYELKYPVSTLEINIEPFL